jgi:hypothetical protein
MIKINKEFLEKIKEIERELERYQIISDYYDKNPERIGDNKFVFPDIIRRLKDIYELNIPKKLKEQDLELIVYFTLRKNI